MKRMQFVGVSAESKTVCDVSKIGGLKKKSI
jgi:hypothetical protein